MMLSLNYLILGQATSNILNVPIGENSKINDVDIKFDQLTVVNFKDILFNNRRELLVIATMEYLEIQA